MFRDSVRIGARVFCIIERASDDVLDKNPDVASYIDHIASQIVIRSDPGLSRDARDELLMHEILHAIVKNAGLDQCLREGFTEEFLVSALAPRIHDLITRNAFDDGHS